MSRDKIEKWDEVNGITAPERSLEAFLESRTDTYVILQLRDSEDTRYERVASYSALQKQGKEPEIDHYDVVYLAPLPPFQDREMLLEQMSVRFNFNHPADFRGHSLSISDIVALNTGGEVSCHYVDSAGFVELPGFFSGKNHLRSAEDSLEQNDNSLDGVINNLPDERAGRSRSEEKPSVLEQLKGLQPPGRTMAPHQPTERSRE